MSAEQMNSPANPNAAPRSTGLRASLARPLAITVAVLFFISAAFPVVAGLSKNTASFPKAWGMLDVGLAFVLALLALVMMALVEGKVNKQATDASYRTYRILTHGILVMLIVFFLGDRIIWLNCLTGFAWRAWLLLYALPSWFTALGMSTPSLPRSDLNVQA